MPNSDKQKKVNRSRKSVQLQLPSAHNSSVNPLTARSTALSFSTTSYPPEPSTSTPEKGDWRRGVHQNDPTQAHHSSRSDQLLASFTGYPQSSIPRQMAMAAMSVISPPSSNYDVLEGGMGPSRIGTPPQQKGWRRFGWKKFAIGAAALICVVWLWGPRESRFGWQKVGTGIQSGLGGGRTNNPPDVLVPPIHYEEDYAADLSKAPLSFETDPDPRKTLSCTKAYHPSSHLVQYALMIDAGSTGSRIHVYKFNNCKPSPGYEYEVFKMTQPGLSSFAGKPVEAAQSLDVLLDEAVRVVPAELHHCTPVAVKATAGLRLLPGRQSADILEKVEQRIKDNYAFQLPERAPVAIMDGKDEGVYAWITANYLLGAISAGNAGKYNKASAAAATSSTTYAVLDLGGASTQIVFEPNFTPNRGGEGRLEAGEHKYDLNFGGRTYELYQHSYLGYGLMKARSHVHRLVEFMASIRPGGTIGSAVVSNPCIAQRTHRVVEITDEVTHKARNVTMSGEDVGSFEACDRVVQLVLAKDAVCEVKPCSFNGVYQPSLLDSFKNGKVLLLSYFYDRLAPLLQAPTRSKVEQSVLRVDLFASIAKTVCLGPEAWRAVPHWAQNQELLGEMAGRPEWCLDLTFMHALLKMGYEFEEDRRVDIGKKIANTELGWCLGAAIAMVSGGELKCKA